MTSSRCICDGQPCGDDFCFSTVRVQRTNSHAPHGKQQLVVAGFSTVPTMNKATCTGMSPCDSQKTAACKRWSAIVVMSRYVHAVKT